MAICITQRKIIRQKNVGMVICCKQIRKNLDSLQCNFTIEAHRTSSCCIYSFFFTMVDFFVDDLFYWYVMLLTDNNDAQTKTIN
jgi:hypothetical protein